MSAKTKHTDDSDPVSVLIGSMRAMALGDIGRDVRMAAARAIGAMSAEECSRANAAAKRLVLEFRKSMPDARKIRAQERAMRTSGLTALAARMGALRKGAGPEPCA